MKFEFVQLSDFIDHVDVGCPQCGERAVVKKTSERVRPRFSCLHCGYVKEWDGNLGITATGNMRLIKGVVNMVKSSDPYFGFALWYQTSCCGHTLWAYNERHLQFYEAYIGDKLRERAPNEHGWSNRSLQSRLPQWMLSGKNRDTILKKIAKLKEK